MATQSHSTRPPTADSAANGSFRDVIGSKSDTHSGTSIFALVKQLKEHAHAVASVLPTMADGVVVTAADTDWTGLGAFAVVAAANAITSDFDIHYISVENISANGVYELSLWSGADAAEVLIGTVRLVQNAVQDSTVNIPFMTPLIAANTQIKAKLASDNAAADTVTISLGYHTY